MSLYSKIVPLSTDCSLLLCGVSIVGALFLIIIVLILKVLLTKLPHTTTTITIWYRSGRAQD